ncbi:hypothetical protein M9H77_17271 [Catharanthus roseus]|uniref:Uncharacterized protein n=1 Tax=Catharanthus roseus TaxID=4058 RepID=A0ACC0B4I0_CATRO|nr:hypothetical protein M9H77_17271 [Catharanthus roseus]
MCQPNTVDGPLIGQATQCPSSQNKGTFLKGSPKYTDDESSSTGSGNEVHYRNPMYESSMAKNSTVSSVSPGMMTGTLSTKE